MIRNQQPPPRSPLSISGFSLVEMMVAVAIIAILATVAVPAFQNMIVQSRLTSQANSFIDIIQAARGEAIKRNQQLLLCRTTSATSTDCPGAGNWEFWIVTNPSGTVVRRGNILRDGNNQALLVVTSTFTQAQVIFSPDGTNNITPGNDSLTLCDPTGSGNIKARLITVGLAGKTSITKTPGAC